MAITWTTEITVDDVPAKRVAITAVRTDSADPDNPRTYGPFKTILAPKDGETLAQMRDRIAQQIYASYTAEITREANVAAVVATYETQLATALDGLET